MRQPARSLVRAARPPRIGQRHGSRRPTPRTRVSACCCPAVVYAFLAQRPRTPRGTPSAVPPGARVGPVAPAARPPSTGVVEGEESGGVADLDRVRRSLMHTRSQPQRLRGPQGEAGFTLTELMVAMIIMAVGLLSAGSLFVFSQRHALHGRTETIAVCLAEEIREKILSENFDDLKTMFDNVDTDIPESLTLPCTDWATHVHEGLGPSGRGAVQVLDETEDPEITSGMRTVVVVISWDERGETAEVSLRFSVSQVGVQSQAGGGA
ncbi:MAG: prepilin-type N-terminal cleavage/methylation domain-containing protein [Candidatus Eisenbacteria bacterium]|nr:prepilin-type N-terminal cleavage/methylation domain-containing protein [Candidatus Eisenbacteria bacterium]